jgi:alcohol dehydrogenase, propanol-preferring
MQAMVLRRLGGPLVMEERARPAPGPGEIIIRVEACGVCRTDLHVLDGELADQPLPIVPGHEVVGRVEEIGAGVTGFAIGERVGAPWLAHACGQCFFCDSGRENLCDRPEFNGYTRDGGYASHMLAEAAFALKLPGHADAIATAPLLCAGLIGWRCLKAAGDGQRIGLYGFGASAHIVAQVARHQGRSVFAYTKPGDAKGQDFARGLGAIWAGGSDATAPEQLDAAILFAPVGDLVPTALRAVRKGGRVVCGGIHMSDIPSFPYAWLWSEREVVSVANLARHDGVEFLQVAQKAGVRTATRRYDLANANEALADLRAGRFEGAAVLTP